ncbi:hypothetical protein [Amycolatopsis sp. 195334CR]|uniref:hypothetical protein n=1 Tax=Amycolatopsis sp. 195334CR TaxID=2814588 RepID=UPI001A8FE088|nr:hypothetical protein [Amycolatopsis sp. 195334CR]MBN6040011.1 hypothetical protein [Amycolatopsis sp. 195334CR]
MSAPKLTSPQVALLRAVAVGEVCNMGSHSYYGRVDGGRHQKLTARARGLRDLGLINPHGVAIKHGKPMPATEEFADHFVVTLTPASEQALHTGVVAVDEGPVGDER